MKATVEYEVDIKLSPEDVFDYCSDHSHEPEWSPTFEDCGKAHLCMGRCAPSFDGST